jgi:hypothetical protein
VSWRHYVEVREIGKEEVRSKERSDEPGVEISLEDDEVGLGEIEEKIGSLRLTRRQGRDEPHILASSEDERERR